MLAMCEQESMTERRERSVGGDCGSRITEECGVLAGIKASVEYGVADIESVTMKVSKIELSECLNKMGGRNVKA